MDNTPCPKPGCRRSVEIRGLCYVHYNAARKRDEIPLLTPEDRLWAKVEVTGFCWNWTGARKKYGHGHLKWQGRYQQAHRVIYELLVGPIPAAHHVDHLCRNPPCVNPDHLEPVPPRTNYNRGYSPPGINSRKTHCYQGHEFTPGNTRTSKDNERTCRTCDAARARERRRTA